MSQCNNNRTKVHNKSNVLKSSWNHPRPIPFGPQKKFSSPNQSRCWNSWYHCLGIPQKWSFWKEILHLVIQQTLIEKLERDSPFGYSADTYWEAPSQASYLKWGGRKVTEKHSPSLPATYSVFGPARPTWISCHSTRQWGPGLSSGSVGTLRKKDSPLPCFRGERQWEHSALLT